MSWYERYGRSFYDNYWSSAHRQWGFQEFHAKAVEWLSGCRHVIDAGAGYGVLTAKLLEMGIDTWAIDLSRLGAKLGPKQFVVASLENPPFKPHLFDGVAAIEVLEHLDNLTAGFEAVDYLLQRPGRVFITVPRPDFPSQEHKWRLTAEEWDRLIRKRYPDSHIERMDDPDRYIFGLDVR